MRHIIRRTAEFVRKQPTGVAAAIEIIQASQSGNATFEFLANGGRFNTFFNSLLQVCGGMDNCHCTTSFHMLATGRQTCCALAHETLGVCRTRMGLERLLRRPLRYLGSAPMVLIAIPRVKLRSKLGSPLWK